MTGQTPETGRRPDRAAFIIAALLAAFGAVLLWDASYIADKAGYAGVGPDAMPKLVGVVLIVLAALTAFQGTRGHGSDVPRQNPVPLLWIGAGMAVQIGLLPLIGFSFASGILFAFTAAAFGKRKLLVTLPIGFALAFVVYGIFDQILQLNLPAGPLETLIYGD